MKPTRLAFIALVFLLGTLPAQARHALYGVLKDGDQAGGMFFHITADPLPDGGAKFRVVITENQASFSERPFAELGILKSDQSSRSIEPRQKLTAVRKGKTLTYDFTVDRASLQNPDFCFLFSNLDHAINHKLLFLVPADFVFARLKDFAPRQR